MTITKAEMTGVEAKDGQGLDAVIAKLTGAGRDDAHAMLRAIFEGGYAAALRDAVIDLREVKELTAAAFLIENNGA